MIDLTLYESGEGGELVLNDNDLGSTDSLFNQVYIAWFGGNVEDYDRDRDIFVEGEQRKEYWQDNLFSVQDIDAKMVSRLEYGLLNVALTSQGIFELERLALEDLEFLDKMAEVSVEVNLINVDRISIIAILKQKEIQEELRFNFIWDATQLEMIQKIII